MFNQLKRIKYKLNNYYIYDSKKAFKETIKFYIADKRNCFNYFHIPKTGGKYIKKILSTNLSKNQFRAYEHFVRAKWLNPKEKVIISVRDPVDRFISCYYSDIRNYEKNNVALSNFGKLLYKNYPNIESAIKAYIKGEKEIGYLAQLGFMSSINYWGNKKDFSKFENLTIIRTEFLQQDLLDFLNNEFSEYKNWNEIINNFNGERFKQTEKKEYKINHNLRYDLLDFLSEEYKLYNYLLSRKIY